MENTNNKITYEMRYPKMWLALQEGRVTEEEWKEFCDALLEQEIEKNKDVMVRLKNR